MVNVISKVVNDFLEDGTKVAQYRQGLELLKKAGFLDLLRKFGYPGIIDQGNNANAMAVEAGRSHGFQTAVTHLEFFMEMYALKSKEENRMPTFGAEKIVLKDKLLTAEELKSINKGAKI